MSCAHVRMSWTCLCVVGSWMLSSAAHLVVVLFEPTLGVTLAKGCIPLNQLSTAVQCFTLTDAKAQAGPSHPPPKIWLRVVRGTRGPHMQPRARKRVYFVRHGESTWNLAQKSGKVLKMLAYDHALTQVGQ